MKEINCPICGGEIGDGVCRYCKTPLKGDSLEVYNNRYDYMKIYNNIIRPKFADGRKLSKEEDNIFKLLLKYDVISDDELDDLRVIFYILAQVKIVSYETFEYVIKRATEKNMRQLANNRIAYYHPVALINDSKESCGSACRYYSVALQRDTIKRLYNGEYTPLVTYYHEMTHIEQSMESYLNNFSPELMIMIKDFIITDFENVHYKTKTYYMDNYKNLPSEIEAEELGILKTMYILRMLNLNYDIDVLRQRRSYFSGERLNRSRVVRENDNEVIKDIDDVFLETINKDKKYLLTYPQLLIEFIEEDGIVRKKTKEELIEEMEKYEEDSPIRKYIADIIKGLSSFSN